MSIAFDRFLKEYSATGHEKLDGYTLSNLDGLTAVEREQAISLLKSEAPQFVGAYEPLARLSPAAALEVLLLIEHDQPRSEFRAAYALYYWLWKLTGQEDYEKKFVESRRSVPNSSLPAYFAYAAQMAESRHIEMMLEGAVLSETDETAVGSAARTLLNKHGFSRENPATKAEYLALWRTLTEGSPAQKIAILNRLTSGS